MNIAPLAFVAVVVPTLLGACSGSDSSGAPTGPDGGGGAGAGGSAGSAGSAGTDAGGAGCRLGTAVTVNAANIDTITAQGDRILYIDRGVGPAGNLPGSHAGALVQINVDGSGETTLYAAPASTSVSSYLATADTIYLLQAEGTSPAAAVLYTLPRAGGTPAPVPAAPKFDPLLAYPFAVSGDNLFVFSPQLTGSSMQIHRVSISSGADAVIADKNTLVFTGSQLAGGKVWFVADQGNGGVFAVDANASAPSADAALTTDTCAHLLVGSSFFLCTSGDTNRYDMSGTKLGQFALPGPNNPAAVLLDGDTVYSIPRLDVAPYEIHSVSVSTGQSALAACARGFISAITYDATNLVWKENGPSGPALVRVAR